MPQRQKTDRTRCLSECQAADLINAVAFAHATRAPLIVAMILLWPHVEGFEVDELGPMTTRLLDRISKWLCRTEGIRLRAVWTRERGREKGHHLHMMLNLPVKLIWKFKTYLESSFGISRGGIEFSFGQFGMLIPTMQMGELKYLCKSLDHRAFRYFGFETVPVADALGLQHQGTDGEILVKRAGWTENIGRTARCRAGWRELRSLDDLYYALNPDKRV